VSSYHVEVSHWFVESNSDGCERALSLDAGRDSLPRRSDSLVFEHRLQRVEQSAVDRIGLVLHLQAHLGRVERNRAELAERSGRRRQHSTIRQGEKHSGPLSWTARTGSVPLLSVATPLPCFLPSSAAHVCTCVRVLVRMRAGADGAASGLLGALMVTAAHTDEQSGSCRRMNTNAHRIESDSSVNRH